MASVLTATFDPANSRVLLTGTGLGAATSCSMFSRVFTTSTFNRVRGTQNVPVTGGVAQLVYDYEFPANGNVPVTVEYIMTDNLAVQSNVPTVVVDVVGDSWMKLPGFPFLNQLVQIVAHYGDVQRANRGVLLPTIANRRPLAIQEFMSGFAFDITIKTTTFAQWQILDTALSLGAVLFFHWDQNAMAGLPSIYAIVTQYSSTKFGPVYSEGRYTKLSLQEVATPSSAYAGSIGTWQSVINQYATWNTVVTTVATWQDLANTAGSPGDVLVS